MSTPRRRSPLPPILLVLVPLSLLQTFWGLLPVPGTDPARVINGVLVLPPANLIGAVAVAVTWTWAVTAGAAAVAGADRPVRRALQLLPTVSGALGAAFAAVLVAMLLAGLALPVAADAIWVVLVLLVLPLGPLLVRFALVLPIAVFEDVRGRAAFRTASAAAGRHVVSLALLLLLGVAAPAQLVGWVFGRPQEFVSGHLAGVGVWLLRDVTLVALALLQVATLVTAYRNLPGRQVPERAAASTGAGQVFPHRKWVSRIVVPLGVVAVVLPTALAGGVVASERLAEVNVQEWPQSARLVALGWPAGRHPVVIGQSAIHDCLDDRCGTVRSTKLSVTMFEPYGGAAIAPDGAVWALGQDELEHCDAGRVCRRADGMLDALALSQREAIALAPEGGVLIAAAVPLRPWPDGRPGRASMIELKLLRCADVYCLRPRSVTLGRVEDSFSDESSAGRRQEIMVGTDREGRPVVAFRSSTRVWVGWCATSSCDSAQVAVHGLSEPQRPSDMPTDEDLALLHFGEMFHCLKEYGCGSREPVFVADRPDGGIYGVGVGPAPSEGFHIRVGRAVPSPRWAVLWSCGNPLCRAPRTIPLVELPNEFGSAGATGGPPGLLDSPDEFGSANTTGRPPGQAWFIAANPDGRVVAASMSPEQIVTVRP